MRKLKEAKVAREIEDKYSKDKILELYLNQINLGNGAYGVETASQRYFGKSVRDLNIAEAATLAALPKAPERYNPRRYPDRAIQRRNTIIELMRENGAIIDADASLAQGLSAAARNASRSRRDRAVLRRMGAPAARRAVRQPAVHRRAQGLHDARPRHADGRRARARAPDARNRGRQVGAFNHQATRSTSPSSRRESPAPESRRTCRARSSRWIRAPAPSAR